MTDRATMQRMAAASSQDYADITSLAQVSRERGSRFERGYPPRLSAEWWALRLRVEEIIAKGQRRRKSHWTRDEVELSEAAKGTALGDEECEARYQALGEDGMHALLSGARPRAIRGGLHRGEAADEPAQPAGERR